MLNQYSKKIILIGLFLIQIIFMGMSLVVSDILLLASIETIMLVIQLFYMYGITKSIANFPNVFLLISYIFNIPTIFLGEIFEYKGILFYRFFRNAIVIGSLKYYIIITFFLWLGTLTKRYPQKQYLSMISKNKFTLKDIRTAGIVFMMIGFIPNIYIALEKFLVRKSGSYIDTYGVDVSGVGILSFFLYFGAILYMYSCENKKSAFKTFIICIPSMILRMLSGNRYDSICLIVVLLYLYVNRIE